MNRNISISLIFQDNYVKTVQVPVQRKVYAVSPFFPLEIMEAIQHNICNTFLAGWILHLAAFSRCPFNFCSFGFDGWAGLLLYRSSHARHSVCRIRLKGGEDPPNQLFLLPFLSPHIPPPSPRVPSQASRSSAQNSISYLSTTAAGQALKYL